MQEKHDFDTNECSQGVAEPAAARAQRAGKERITIRLDADVTAYFRGQATGGGNYQSLINEALRQHIQTHEGVLERILRRVIHQELASVQPAATAAASSSAASPRSPTPSPATSLRSRLPLLSHGLSRLLKLPR